MLYYETHHLPIEKQFEHTNYRHKLAGRLLRWNVRPANPLKWNSVLSGCILKRGSGGRFNATISVSVVALTLVVLWICIALFFFIDTIITASSSDYIADYSCCEPWREDCGSCCPGVWLESHLTCGGSGTSGGTCPPGITSANIGKWNSHSFCHQ